ncbi:MAG: hypothetical protein RMK62_12585 [Armatimonadota bacterium]|nr:hypothetical protein [Armatimonadota bacterium]
MRWTVALIAKLFSGQKIAQCPLLRQTGDESICLNPFAGKKRMPDVLTVFAEMIPNFSPSLHPDPLGLHRSLHGLLQ